MVKQLHHKELISSWSNHFTDVKHQLKIAHAKNKLTMIDFYADWCISCKEMDNFTFTHPEVQKALTRFHVLRADVTKNDLTDKLLEQHYGVVAPPTILFFDKQGKEIPHSRIIGEVGATKFLNHLKQVEQAL